jgi:hypothetical protein
VRSAAALLAAVAALAGCQRSLDENGPAPARSADDEVLRRHMRHGFDLLRSIQLLAIAGKLDATRALSRSLAGVPAAAGVEGWAGAEVVRARAQELAAATTIAEACRGTARIAEACAGCHADAGASPAFAPPPPPPLDLTSVSARMARHRWATDRLWEGVVGASDAAWNAGLDVLAAEPQPWPELAGDRAIHAQRLHDAAERARGTAGDRAERARTFGELLVICAGCHADPTWLASR